MKMILAASIALLSVSAFSMELDYFEDNCPRQLAQIAEIDSRVESQPDSERNHAIASVIMASIRGYIGDAEKCEDTDSDIPKVLLVMKQLKVK